nr:PKD domain-containing protein [Candidatus Sigynarchaeota archaeon]
MRSHDNGRDVPVRRMNRWPWQRVATPLVLLALASCVVTGTLIGLLARTGGIDVRDSGSIEPSGGIPMANFTTNATIVLAGDRAGFMFTGDRGDEPCMFQWSFGDGSANATTENATHTFLVASTFDVALTVTDAGNETSTLAKVGYIIVLSAPGDADGDGLANQDELRVRHTDPLRSDTDGDGWGDGKEVLIGKNPLNATDFPRTGDLFWSIRTSGSIIASPAIGDVDGDGKAEIMIGSCDKRLYCLSGATGVVEWSFLVGDFIRASPVIADVNDDGLMEILFGSDDNKMHCLYGTNGTERWSFLTGGDVQSCPAIGDVNNDSTIEVIFGSYDCWMYCLSGINGSIKWKFPTEGSIPAGITTADANRDGIYEIYAGSVYHHLFCLSGLNGSMIWNISGDTNHGFVSTPAIADCDSDGNLELVVGCDDSYVYCVKALSGSIVWRYLTSGWIGGNPSIVDVDRDGKLEVLIGSSDKRMYCLTASNGSLEWAFRTGDEVNTNPVVGDVDSDDQFEVIFGSSDYRLYCLSGDSGSLEWSRLTGNDVWSNPAVGDVDGDGRLEIVFGSLDWKVYCLACTGPFWALPGPWSISGGSSFRTGIYIDNDSDGLIDAHEIVIGTDPANADTDGDGSPDGSEIDGLTNPLDPLDYPSSRPPIAAFSWTPAAPVVGQAVQFTDASYDIDGTITSWSWDFGDNTAGSSERHPLHAFAAAGTYAVTLAVADNENMTCTLSSSIIVAQDRVPVAIFTTNATSIIAGQSIAFTFAGSPGNAPATFQWSFGDGSPNNTMQNQVHRYVVAGNYTTRLTITDADGDTNVASIAVIVTPVDLRPVASFHSNTTAGMGIGTRVAFTFDGSGGDGTPAFSWDFDDGTGSTSRDTVHAYGALGTYNVTLTVTDADGDVDTAVAPGYVIIIDLFPSVVFTTNSTTIVAGEWVAFTFTGTRGDAPATFQWSFGDGSPNATAQNPVHQYTAAGMFISRLLIRDVDGDANTATMMIHVLLPDLPPVASFHSNATTDMGIGTAVEFTFDGTCGNGTPSFHWNFGDGVFSTSRDPVHVYWSVGAFDVNVTVIDGIGRSDTMVRPGYVVLVDLFPSATFIANATLIAAGEWIAFTFSGTTGDGAAMFSWDFGDGSANATSQDPVHQYKIIGNFTITLVVIDADGDASVQRLSIAVYSDQAPMLSDAVVSQFPGTGAATITFSVTYTHSWNVAPAFLYVVIDGQSTAMVKIDANDMNCSDGCRYSITSTVPFGQHEYLFNCSDGWNMVSTAPVVLDVEPGTGTSGMTLGDVKLASIVLSIACTAGALSTGVVSRRDRIKKRRAMALETERTFSTEQEAAMT